MSTVSANVSPPPLKRRRLSSSIIPQPTATDKCAPLTDFTIRGESDQKTNPLHIYSWNINGIAPFIPPSTPKIATFLKSLPRKKLPSQPCLRACLSRWSWPHLLALQEVKVAPSDAKTQASIRRVVNVLLKSEEENDRSRPLYDAHFCLPQDKHNTAGFGGKMYGVCTIIRRDLKDVKLRSVDWDLEGRVLICEIPESRLAVVNLYAVNGTTYDYRDPETGKVLGDRHGRKRVFHTLLAEEVRRYEKGGWNVVIAGDINISRSKIDSFPQLRMGEDHIRNRADFEEKFMRGLGMIDTFRLMKNDNRKYSYRPRGKIWGQGGDRVDMILVTKEMRDTVKDADILDTEEERGPSDHVPLLVEVDVRNIDRQNKTIT